MASSRGESLQYLNQTSLGPTSVYTGVHFIKVKLIVLFKEGFTVDIQI
jgi:hypothetical protein